MVDFNEDENTLSDKSFEESTGSINVINVDDVEQFIKNLKEDIRQLAYSKEDTFKIIDKLAGDKLI